MSWAPGAARRGAELPRTPSRGVVYPRLLTETTVVCAWPPGSEVTSIVDIVYPLGWSSFKTPARRSFGNAWAQNPREAAPPRAVFSFPPIRTCPRSTRWGWWSGAKDAQGLARWARM